MATKPLDEEAVFHAARRIPSVEERAKFIGQACGEDAALAERVRSLLDIYDRDPEFQKGAIQSPGKTFVYPPIAERTGACVGAYRLMERIGEGGFGLVFVAEQLQPVKRKVALKIIKPGMDSAQVIARFEAERQALALMDHPNIAHVLDAGSTESGRPYFVMELVRGIPITDYCDQNQLTPRERLELFITVCHAIQHAHQKGIIHRDIKPSNVLVTSHDGKPVVKVIDFGVAKAIHQHLTERTIYTQFAQMVGTPLYMSPEQAEMSGLDIDTRSDVYSLGVLMYELLTGMTPIDKKRLVKAAYDEIRRMIREDEPAKPSTRLSTADSIASIAAQRRTEPARLPKLIRGDLDWITMKALEKDRTRRYETANALARDIQRYLADEVVEARPPSSAYRLRKFAKKNRVALTTTVAIALLLVAGVVASTGEAVRATRAERAAQSSAAEAVAAQQAESLQRELAEAAARAQKAAKETAEAREAETKAVLDFVESKVFAAARPQGQEGGLGRAVTLRSAIEAALPFAHSSFRDQPLIEARLRSTLGSSYLYLGQAAIAAEQFREAQALFTKHMGPDHPETLRSMFNLSKCYYDLGRQADALKLREDTLARQRAKLGADHPDTLITMSYLANNYDFFGRHADALKLRKPALALMTVKLGPDHPETLFSMKGLAYTYNLLGRHADALRVNEEILAVEKTKLGPDHPETLLTMHNLAATYYALGRLTEAIKLNEETSLLWKTKLGPDHPDTLTSMNNLAESYRCGGRIQEAIKLHEETLRLRTAKLGRNHPDTLRSMQNLADNYHSLGRDAEAVKLGEETLGLRKAHLGPNHPETLQSMNHLAATYAAVGRYADAIELCRQSTALWEKANRTDPFSLYRAACFRAVAAAVLRAADKSPEGARHANAQADQAMVWLKQAVAAGWKSGVWLKNYDDFKALRERDDFKKLLDELERDKSTIK